MTHRGSETIRNVQLSALFNPAEGCSPRRSERLPYEQHLHDTTGSSPTFSIMSESHDLPELVHTASPTPSPSLPVTPDLLLHAYPSPDATEVAVTDEKPDAPSAFAKKRGFKGAPLDLPKQQPVQGMFNPLSPLLSSSLRSSFIGRVSSFISRSPLPTATPVLGADPSPVDYGVPDPFAVVGESFLSDAVTHTSREIYDLIMYTSPEPKPRSLRESVMRAPSVRRRPNLTLQVYEACIPNVDAPAVTLIRAASASARSDEVARRRRERRTLLLCSSMSAFTDSSPSSAERRRQCDDYLRTLSPRQAPRLRSLIPPKRLGMSNAWVVPQMEMPSDSTMHTRRIDNLIGLINHRIECEAENVSSNATSSKAAVSD